MMPEWCYTYRSPDGVRHEARVRAPGRDAAFAQLRRQGIRPMKLYPAPGMLNWISSGGWKLVMVALFAIIVLALLAWPRVAEHAVLDTLPRHQLAGLPDDWESRLRDCFSPTDAYLALFAQPGRMEHGDLSQMRNSLTVESLLREVPRPVANDPNWVIALKRVLRGMKEEAAALVKLGKKPVEIAVWLEERQRMEAAYRRQILEGNDSNDEKRRRLKAMGLSP